MNVELKWEPHDEQRKFLDRDERFRVLCWGRRSGKNEAALIDLFVFAVENPDSTCWWVSPSYTQSNDYGFDRLVEIVPEVLLDGDPKRSAPREVQFINGSVVVFKSADRPKTLKGGGVAHCVLDEAASIPSGVWHEYVRPTLSDKPIGDAVILSTPKSKNWFHDVFRKGQDESVGGYWSSHATTFVNPFVPDSEVEAAKGELPTRIFEQEYLAEWQQDGGSVFPEISIGSYSMDGYEGESPFSIGVDFARHEAYTAVVVLDAVGRVADTRRTQAVSWREIQGMIEGVADRYAPNTVRVDATRDNKITEDLRRESGLTVEGVSFSGGRKRELIENLAATMEQGEIEVASDAGQLQRELEAFEYSVTSRGHPQYSAPSDMDDDMVDAAALAAHQDFTDRENKSVLTPVLGSVRRGSSGRRSARSKTAQAERQLERLRHN